MKKIFWLADTLKQLSDFPDEIIKEIGFALFCEQAKSFNPNIKPLKGFSETVREIVSRHKGNAYRAIYVINLGDAFYVLHVFQKKSKSGKATPKPDLDLIKKRLKQAKEKIEGDKS